MYEISIGELISVELDEVYEVLYSEAENNVLIVKMKDGRNLKLTLLEIN